MIKTIKHIYSVTIDRSNFREAATRILAFAFPILLWGRSVNFWGFPIVILGVLIRAWGAGHLYKDQKFSKSGPYHFVRHPLYLGSCLLSLGLIIVLSHWAVTITLGILTLLQYLHTIQHEDKNLLLMFGNQYAEYMKTTGTIVPSVSNFGKSFKDFKNDPFRFSIKQYFHNKEYELLLGVLAIFAIIYIGQVSKSI
jgi:hypothetical protein